VASSVARYGRAWEAKQAGLYGTGGRVSGFRATDKSVWRGEKEHSGGRRLFSAQN
jgi:hypothetical protein